MSKLFLLIVSILLFISLLHLHIGSIETDRYRLIAKVAARQNNIPAVFQAAQRGLAINPYSLELYAYRGAAMAYGGNWYPALKDYLRILKYQPYNLGLLMNTALAYHKVGDNENALRMVKRLEQIKPSYVRRKNAS